MYRTAFATLLALLALAIPVRSDELRVVATLPDLADMLREIGGARVSITTLTRGKENLHAVSARPSHLVAMSRADLFVQIGLSLESSFVPGLMENARNAKIRPGAAGFVNVSEGFEVVDKPADLSRSGGDVHPQGNPHMNLDPRAGRLMAQRILEGLIRVDPGSQALYEERFATYAKELDRASSRWEAMQKAWHGRTVVVYHQEYHYFARAAGITIVGAIESKPGIPPTPNHVASLVASMKRQGCKVILTASWSKNDEVEQVARATGARVVELPNQVGGLPATETWIGMMDAIHRRLSEAFGTAYVDK